MSDKNGNKQKSLAKRIFDIFGYATVTKALSNFRGKYMTSAA